MSGAYFGCASATTDIPEQHFTVVRHPAYGVSRNYGCSLYMALRGFTFEARGIFRLRPLTRRRQIEREHAMVASISNSTVSNWSSALFSKLDTKKQGFIEKADLQATFAATGDGSAMTADTDAADKLFAQLDTDQNGQISKSELSSAIEKVAGELNAQLDQTRVAKGSHAHAGGPPPGGAPGGAAPAAKSDDDTSSSYNAAADTDGDGSVSVAEAAAYAKAQASGATAAATSRSEGVTKDQLVDLRDQGGATDRAHQQQLTRLIDNFDKADADGDGTLTRKEGQDFMKNQPKAAGNQGDIDHRALSKALQLLKAYVDSGAEGDARKTAAVDTQA
ncbi:MAG: EF-hand domain-containing protein [Massilia sp.]